MIASFIGLNWIWASHESFISISSQNTWEYAGTANEAPGPVGVRSIRVCKGFFQIQIVESLLGFCAAAKNTKN